MNIYRLILLTGMLGLSTLVLASDPGITTRDAELYAKPSYQAEQIRTLERNTKLSVLERKGGWYLIETDNDTQQGWIRMLSIRLGTGTKKKGDSGISALSQFARTGQSGQVVATGVRGLSEENIREAKPDITELKKMQGFQTTPNKARTFASQSDLKSRDIAFLEEPKKQSSSTNNSFSFSD
jgi:hypothetical protein